jgi:aryl-alcohol dehydrogenase-like predicted oxidoreductase
MTADVELLTSVPLGDIGEVARIGLGGSRFCGPNAYGKPPDPAKCTETVQSAVDSGVSLIDTADSYGPEWSEEIIGRSLRSSRTRPVLATKVGLHRDKAGSWIVDVSPRSLRTAAEASLRRLRVEAIDLLQLHAPSRRVPIEETVAVLQDLRRAGLVRQVGVCNVSPAQLAAAMTTGPIATVQNQLNLATFGAADLATLSMCEESGIRYLAYQPLADGVLLRADRIRATAAELSVTRAQLLLRILLRLSDSVVAIPGTCDPDHVRANVASLTVRLGDRDRDIADRVVARIRLSSREQEGAEHEAI